ncbi:MAG: AAA family ATPase [Clostridia bacterium]|nr:AAA family ATPase [Clostridia bacterium]
MQKLIMIIGVPGSGKTTKAKEILQDPQYAGFDTTHYEADMFFETEGDYNFDPSRLKDAHEWCQSNVERDIVCGRVVIVSNTFTKAWERKPYFDMCRKYKYPVQIIRMTGIFGNVHNVPAEKVAQMRENTEFVTEKELDGLTVKFGLSEL